MFNYNLINTPSFDINKKTIDSMVIVISKIVWKTQKWTLNIVFVDDDSIKNLNKQYRKIDKVTDVLSFAYFDNFENLDDEETAWEIVLSEEKIITQAKEYGLWKEKEFYKLVIHSILHILWYDHEKENDYKIMQDLENKIWEQIFEK